MAIITKKVETPITWEEISEAVKTGRAAEVLSVGDEISETLTTGEEVVFVVAGIDIYAEKQVIFSLKDCLAEEYYMNKTWPNKGGWPTCGMRKYLNNDILKTLPENLRAVIIPRTLTTNDGEATDSLWLFSEYEIFGADWCDKDPGDRHIPYYENPGNRCKGLGKNGTAYAWWERSPNATSAATFCFVNSDGVAGYYNASSARGVCFGFCI